MLSTDVFSKRRRKSKPGSGCLIGADEVSEHPFRHIPTLFGATVEKQAVIFTLAVGRSNLSTPQVNGIITIYVK
ncbi:MAG: hypothetical protein PHI67_09765 [Candidatus Methanomethylophilaceae archaeon]|nr:hypothetical protein [Candidatus Methanomethylophilaceae archaeon]